MATEHDVRGSKEDFELAGVNKTQYVRTANFFIKFNLYRRLQIVTAVRKNGTPVWYLMAKDEGHGFVKKKNANFQFYATVLFMQEYLLK